MKLIEQIINIDEDYVLCDTEEKVKQFVEIAVSLQCYVDNLFFHGYDQHKEKTCCYITQIGDGYAIGTSTQEGLWSHSNMMDFDDFKQKAEFLKQLYNIVKSSEYYDYDYRSLDIYCKKKGIEPVDMTIRELQQFIFE